MRIALYVDDGVSSSTINHWLLMAKEGLIDEFEVVKAKDLSHNKLALFNWLILPGGSGSAICSKFTQENRKELHDSIYRGLNVLGVCAGAFALSTGYDWSLNLIINRVADKPNWKRGHGNVKVSFTAHGLKVLKLKKKDWVVNYHNGPVFEKVKLNKDHKVLATFSDDMIAENGKSGLMKGSVAIVQTKHGAGNIIAISPHFEKTPVANKLIKKLLKLYI